MTTTADLRTDAERAKGYARPLRRAYVHQDVCGALTVMKRDSAIALAIVPGFYTEVYCSGCQRTGPVTEFIWDGTREVVGS